MGLGVPLAWPQRLLELEAEEAEGPQLQELAAEAPLGLAQAEAPLVAQQARSPRLHR